MAPPIVGSARSALSDILAAQRMKTGRLRCLPDFLIIGAQRAGTSSLYNYLAESPYILPALKKEVHFFDDGFRHGFPWYRAHFALKLQQRFLERRRGACRIFEASPYYIVHPHAPHRIREALPHAKLIVLLRNPVDRAESAYNHQVRRGREKLSFEEAIAAEPKRLEGELERMIADPAYVSVNHRKFSYITRGQYVDQLPVWTSLFPADQLRIIRSEDFFADPATTVNELAAWLGVPPSPPGQFKKFNQAHYSKMSPAMRARLVAHFAPYNRRLGEFLGRDMGWDG